jgi:hypothetical protein
MFVFFYSGCEEAATNPEPDPQPAGPLQMIYPTGGEVLRIGSEVTLVALCDSTIIGSTVFFRLSLDTGRTWSSELEGASLKLPDNRRLEWSISIPDSIEIGPQKVSTKSTQCLMMVQCYEPLSIKGVSKARFTIQ